MSEVFIPNLHVRRQLWLQQRASWSSYRSSP